MGVRMKYWANIVTLAITPLLIAAAPTSLLGQAAPDPQPDNEIIVTAMGEKGYKLTPEKLRDAARAFDAHRAEFAPNARLLWRFRPANSAQGVRLALRGDNENIPVEVGEEGAFTLPQSKLLTGHYRLVSSAKPGAIRITPLAGSPGSTLTNYRMGDARLTCEVFVGFMRSEMGLFSRAGFSALGGCAGKRIGMMAGTDHPVAAVTIDGWPNKVEIAKDGHGFHVPFYDRSISDDQHIRVTYRP